MYCANCGKTFGKHELVTYTVMPGWSKQVPTCYNDRLCYSRRAPIMIKPPIAVKTVVFIVSRGRAKYCRRYKFKRRRRREPQNF